MNSKVTKLFVSESQAYDVPTPFHQCLLLSTSVSSFTCLNGGHSPMVVGFPSLTYPPPSRQASFKTNASALFLLPLNISPSFPRNFLRACIWKISSKSVPLPLILFNVTLQIHPGKNQQAQEASPLLFGFAVQEADPEGSPNGPLPTMHTASYPFPGLLSHCVLQSKGRAALS